MALVLTRSTAPPPELDGATAGEGALPRLENRPLAGAWGAVRGGERRSEQRQPFPYPLLLTPVDARSLVPLGQALVVLGKHLAERGIDFYTSDPLAFRFLLADLEFAAGGRARYLLEVTWCRFNKFGLYENGGRFLKCLEAPPEFAGITEGSTGRA